MGTRLRFNMILPNGQPLRWNTPGARFGGTVEEVMAAIAQQQQQNNTMSTPYNRISVTVTDQNVTDINAKLGELETLLGFCQPLEDKERQNMQKLGDATAAYAATTLGYMGSHPEYISLLFPMVEVNKDNSVVTQMDKFLARLALLARKAEDTRMLAGNELLRACNAYMNNVGEAARRGQAEAEPIYKDLAAHYPGPGSKAKPTPKPPTP